LNVIKSEILLISDEYLEPTQSWALILKMLGSDHKENK